MNRSERAHVEFSLLWKSPYAEHLDRYSFPRLNFWRDVLPGRFGSHLPQMAEGEERQEDFAPGTLVPLYSETNIFALREGQILTPPGHRGRLELKCGRFYPRGMVLTPVTFPEETRPLRYLGQRESFFLFDLNHPLAAFPITLHAKLIEHLEAKEERGGLCNDVAYTLTDDGPGLQASLPDGDTDFFHHVPFDRSDESDDSLFYARGRFENHVDETALEIISAVYRRFLKPGMRVLDLMSSWNSHLPKDAKNLVVTGLGLNREELNGNNVLQQSVLHDLNCEIPLPFRDREFDAALCTVSVEYLTDPIRVFREVARILKPGAPFVVTFSHRWFPPKVIQLWTDLHLFERLGFILECFRKSDGFSNLRTESIRGLPRPPEDKYFPQFRQSDPVFVAWGETVSP